MDDSFLLINPVMLFCYIKAVEVMVRVNGMCVSFDGQVTYPGCLLCIHPNQHQQDLQNKAGKTMDGCECLPSLC